MNTFVRVAFTCAIALTVDFAGGSEVVAHDFSGTWDSTYGRMTLQQSGRTVSGGYGQDGGRIQGEVDQNRMNGFWAEVYSMHRCNFLRMGSPYWGRLRLDISPEGDSFAGQWSYCDEPVGTTWNGTRQGSGAAGSDTASTFDTSGWHLPDGTSNLVYDNGNMAACGYTDTAQFSVDRPVFLSRIELWADWSVVDGQTVAYGVWLDDRPIGGGVLSPGTCDPYQAQWCQAEDWPHVWLAEGTYTVRSAGKVICQNEATGGLGMIKLFEP